MHISFIPTITVSLSADEWELYGQHDPTTIQDRNKAAIRLSEAAGEALTLAWTALSGDTRVARAMGLPNATLAAITQGMGLEGVQRLAHQHWNAVANSIERLGASDTEACGHFANLVRQYLDESPAQALVRQNTRHRTAKAETEADPEPADARPRRGARRP